MAAVCSLAGACSNAPDSPTATAQQEDCVAAPTASGGYHAECRHRLTYNGKDMGTVLYTHDADPSRSCNDYRSHAQIDGNADAEPGAVDAVLDDTTGKIDYSVDSALITILLSDQRDWFWVRSSVAGAAAETDKMVYCPGLEAAAEQRAQMQGLAGANSCPSSDAHSVDLGDFPCPALAQEIASRDAYKAMFAVDKRYKMAAGMVLVDQAKRISTQPLAGTNRAAIIPVLAVIFSALSNVFGSKDFQALFDNNSKTDNVTGQ
jgi:hypothetical protein